MNFEDEVNLKVQAALDRMSRIPIAALIWGPDVKSGTPIGEARQQLKDYLATRGHLARFSEELIDPNSPRSVVAQQFAQVEAYDVVFSLPGSPGSIAEIHDFARMPGVAHKIVTFVDDGWNDGYANKSLVQMQSTLTCRVQLYSAANLPDGIIACAKDHVERLQELLYCFFGRRC